MTDPRAAALRTSLARLLVLAGALAGLVAMHGLGDHGATPAGSQQAHAQMVSTSPMSHVRGADHGGADADPDEVPPALSAALAPVGTSSGTHMGLMGLCLAVLAGTLLCLVRRRAPRGLVTRLSRDLSVLCAAMGTTSRERDPPCLAQLSILRC